eukprot:gene6894-30872_t
MDNRGPGRSATMSSAPNTPIAYQARQVASAPNSSSPGGRSRPSPVQAVQLPKPAPGSLRKSLPIPLATQGGDKAILFPWLAKGNTGRPLKATNIPKKYTEFFDSLGGPVGPGPGGISRGASGPWVGEGCRPSTMQPTSQGQNRQSVTNRSLRSGASSCGFESGYHSEEAPVWGGSRRVTIPESNSRAVLYTSMLGPNTELDFTLPKHTLRPKAFVNANSVYDRMIIEEDRLADEAATHMQHMEEEKVKRTRAAYDEQFALVKQLEEDKVKWTRAAYDEQFALVKERLQEEVEANKLEAKEMDAKIQRMKEEDEVKRQAEERAYQEVCETVNAQMVELKEFRRVQEEQRHRGMKLDRMHADLLAKKERERLAKLTAEHRAQQREVEDGLKEALKHKAVAKAQQRIDEQLYNAQCIKLLDVAEAKRQAGVEGHAAKLQAAFLRGGGEQLMVQWNEKLQQEKDKVARELHEQELRAQGREKTQVAARQERKDDFITGLNKQVAYKEMARRDGDGAKERERLATQARTEEEARKDEVAATEKREQQLRDFALLKSSALRHTQRIVNMRSDFPGDAENMWVHKNVIEGTARGFTNLSVPVRGNKITLPRHAAETSAC